MGYDGLENPLLFLKAKEFPQKSYTGFQILKDKEIRIVSYVECNVIFVC